MSEERIPDMDLFKINNREEDAKEHKFYTASQFRLIWYKLRKHKLALVGISILLVFYISAIFAPFFSTQNPEKYFEDNLLAPPHKISFIDENGFSIKPFYYEMTKKRNPDSLLLEYTYDKSTKHYISFFVKGYDYKLFGIFPGDRHFIGNREQAPFFLFGTDALGRDLFSRNIYAARISLSIGIVGVMFTFALGCIIGGISGFYGGIPDIIIQRIIEFLLSIPTLPLWMALSAALPREWPQIKVYFIITLILSISGWTGLARVVRGKLISMRNEDYITAAKLYGCSDRRIILRHMLPGFFGYLIVSLFMSIPGMILGETALSFLGLGLRSPVVSWGVLLSQAQNIRTIILYPWIMIPGIFVVITVLAFNFLGDGLRDAADPYREV